MPRHVTNAAKLGRTLDPAGNFHRAPQKPQKSDSLPKVKTQLAREQGPIRAARKTGPASGRHAA